MDQQLVVGIYERVRAQEFRAGPDHVTPVVKVQQTIIGKKPVSAPGSVEGGAEACPVSLGWGAPGRRRAGEGGEGRVPASRGAPYRPVTHRRRAERG